MTINLQQAKRLHELGVRKKAQFVWFTVYADNKYWDKILYEGKLTEDDIAASETICPAYDAEELISMIKGCFSVHVHLDKSAIAVNEPLDMFGYSGDTLTEALGNKLIHDLENGVITSGEVNK